LFVDLCLSHRDQIVELLATRHLNTNEVGRSALLGPALSMVAARLGAPLGLVDVGCSAGVNLYCDKYRLDYGSSGATGPADAAVRVPCDVTGGPAPIAPRLPLIAARVGIDRHPVAVADEDEMRWLLACVWPDTNRVDRMRLALDEVRHSPPQLVRGDALETVTDVVMALPTDAVAVVITTWVLLYLSAERRLEFRHTLASASRHRPIAWICADSPGIVDRLADPDTPAARQAAEANALGLGIFHDGTLDQQRLAFVHPHGSWIDWQATAGVRRQGGRQGVLGHAGGAGSGTAGGPGPLVRSVAEE
jgi:hypothetical protein